MSLLVLIFVLVFGIMMISIAVGTRVVEDQRRKRVSKIVHLAEGPVQVPHATVLVQRVAGARPALATALLKLNIVHTLGSTLQQSGLAWDLSRFAATTLVFAAIGAVLGFKLRFLLSPVLSALALASGAALLPWIHVRRKRRKRLAEFEAQFPEALDFLARAMRAGHAFPASLEMLASESAEPLRSEFRRVFNEHNLGETMAVVLSHLGERVPLVDVRFFVAAVLMQRETGGNLGEILTRLAEVIRERFRLKGQVRAISAHGRITAGVLAVMPVVIVFALMAIEPTYLLDMLKTTEGKYLAIGAVVGQIVGYLCMRKIVNIEV